MATAFGPGDKSASKIQEEFKKMRGYPLTSTTKMDIMGHKSVIVSEVTEVRHGAIAASVWQVPPSYTKIDNPMLRALQVRSRR